MKLLALDTSSDACSAAVWVDGACHTEFEVTPRAHARLVLPMIEAVLQRAGIVLQDLDALAFGCGPGAFTGVRIATGVVQGLALAADKPVIPVSTLAALAQQAWMQHGAERVLVAVDARMNEVYWGEYALQAGQMCLQGEEQVVAPAAVSLSSGQGWMAVGSGWEVYADQLAERLGEQLVGQYPDQYPDQCPYMLPSAEFMLPLAAFAWQQGFVIAADEARPVYLRNKVAQTTRERTGLSV